MTELNKPVRRLSLSSKFSRGKMRRIVVTLLPTGLGLRLAKERRTYTLPYVDLLPLAIRVHQASVKQARKEARKVQKGTR